MKKIKNPARVGAIVAMSTLLIGIVAQSATLDQDEALAREIRERGMRLALTIEKLEAENFQLFGMDSKSVEISAKAFRAAVLEVTDPRQFAGSQNRSLETRPELYLANQEGALTTVSAINYPERLGNGVTLELSQSDLEQIAQLDSRTQDFVKDVLVAHEFIAITLNNTQIDRDYSVSRSIVGGAQMMAQGGISSGGGRYTDILAKSKSPQMQSLITLGREAQQSQIQCVRSQGSNASSYEIRACKSIVTLNSANCVSQKGASASVSQILACRNILTQNQIGCVRSQGSGISTSEILACGTIQNGFATACVQVKGTNASSYTIRACSNVWNTLQVDCVRSQGFSVSVREILACAHL